MKITKSYLKQIIKEEIESLHEVDEIIETHIKLKPSEFLDLTTGEKYPKSALEARLEYAKKDIASKQKDLKKELSKSIPSLTLDFNGKVIDHEGRMRMYYFENYENNIPKEVLIIHPKSLDLSKPNLMLHNQFGEETSVQLNKQQQQNIELSQIEKLVNLTPDILSGKMRDIVLNLTKEKNISKEEAANLLNNELQKYDVIVEPTREQEFAIIIVTSPMVSARIYKKDYKEGSILNDPKSKQFSNPLSYKDKITLRKK